MADCKNLLLVLVVCVAVCSVRGFSSPIKWWEVYDRQVEKSENELPEDPKKMIEMMSSPAGMRKLVGAPGTFAEVEAAMSDLERWAIASPGHIRGGNFQNAADGARLRSRALNEMGPPGTYRARDRAAHAGVRGPPASAPSSYGRPRGNNSQRGSGRGRN